MKATEAKLLGFLKKAPQLMVKLLVWLKNNCGIIPLKHVVC